jgi:hypothetical protein
MIINNGYLNTRPLSATSLSAFQQSPRHYIKYITQKRELTDAMILGLLIETMILEPDKLTSKFVQYEKFDRRTNVDKAKWNDMLNDSILKGYHLINTETWKSAEEAKRSVMDHEHARGLIEGKKGVQVKLAWINKEHGLPITGYEDLTTECWGEEFIVEIKTTAKLNDPDHFIREAAERKFQLQCGLYSEGHPHCYYKFPQFIFLVIETVDPFNVLLFFCPDEYIERAKEEFRNTLKAFRYCMNNNLFHQGYEFWLMGTRKYYTMEYPKYYKSKFQG